MNGATGTIIHIGWPILSEEELVRELADWVRFSLQDAGLHRIKAITNEYELYTKVILELLIIMIYLNHESEN